MDSKALAKSKRAHSLHHSKKSHPKSSPKPKLAPVGAGSSKSTSEKPPQHRQPRADLALPSNWDRYEEELDSDAGAPSGEVSAQSSEVPPPKSKGADYRYLIAEAKSQPHPHSDPFLDTFPSMDDILPDFFSKGAGPLLSTRGEAIVSMTENDSFVIEDKSTGSHEVPFLSLNLNLLAEQLAKVDLAKRLFIEEELLPPELLAEASASSSEKEPVQVRRAQTEAAKKHLGDFNLGDITEEESKEDENIGATTVRKSTFAVNQVAVDTSQLHWHDQIVAPESTKQSSANTVAEPKSETSTFKAAAAEAELDALLGSFEDTKLTDTFDFNTSRPAIRFEESSKVAHQGLSKGWKTSKPGPVPSPANIDVLLDDLLEETSVLTKKNGLHGTESLAPNVSSRPKVLDDFDSWLDTI